MKVLLGPGMEALTVPLTELGIESAVALTPQAAWGWHNAVDDSPRLWVIGEAHWLSQFSDAPWSGVFHLIAVISDGIPPALDGQCMAFTGPMPPNRQADFIRALQWPQAKSLDGTLVSSTRGLVNWLGRGGLPPQLRQHQGSVAVPVVTQAPERWPAAQWLRPGDSDAILPMPLLVPDQWHAQRATLDALAQLRVRLNA